MQHVPKDRLRGRLAREMIDRIEAAVNRRPIPGVHDRPAVRRIR